jgi:hypothetical protein
VVNQTNKRIPPVVVNAAKADNQSEAFEMTTEIPAANVLLA